MRVASSKVLRAWWLQGFRVKDRIQALGAPVLKFESRSMSLIVNIDKADYPDSVCKGKRSHS